MRFFTFFFLILINRFCFAQIGLADRYQFNYLGINPAFAGESSSFGIKAVTDNQLLGLRLNKSSQILVLDGQLYRQTGLAFQGFRITQGILANTGFNLAYSKGFELNEVKIKAGLGGGVLILPNFIGTVLGQRTSTHVGAGLLASYKSFFIGASKPIIVSSKTFPEPKLSYLNVGYLRNVIDENFKLNVNVLLKNYIQKNYVDFNSKVILKDKLSLGLSFRQNIPDLSQNTYSFYPFADYRFSKSTTIGLGYNPTSVIVSQIQGGNIGPSGSIQVYLKFLNVADDDQSWYGSLF
jgi:Type IX secretion system membrane protein PorP/SprF